MNSKLIILALSASVAFAGCSSGSEQVADLESQLKDSQEALADTIAYFNNTISDMQYQMDSMTMVLTTLMPATGSSSTKKPAAPAAPKTPAGQIDVTKKGGGDVPQIDVTKKGGGDEPKIDVTKKGGGN